MRARRTITGMFADEPELLDQIVEEQCKRGSGCRFA